MSKVYLVQERPGINFAPALKFGPVVSLLSHSQNSMFSTAPTVKTLKDGLAEFTKDDMILPAGDPVAIGIAMALAAERTGGRLRVLKWNNLDKVYVPVKVDIFNKHPEFLNGD